jgi:hypothetical protein
MFRENKKQPHSYTNQRLDEWERLLDIDDSISIEKITVPKNYHK